MKKIISIALALAMIISISSVFALPLSAEGIEETASEAVTTVSEEAAVPADTTFVQEVTSVPEEITVAEKTTVSEEPPTASDNCQPDIQPEDGIYEDGEPTGMIETVDFSAGTASNDELFEQYLTKLLYGDVQIRPLASERGRAQLSGEALRIYDELRPHIIAIADGSEKSTTIYLSEGSVLTRSIIKKIFDVLATDFPSETYWMDGCAYGFQQGSYFVSFSIAENYQVTKTDESGTHVEVDTSKIESAKKALDNARRIVGGATGSDYDKIKYFVDEICRLAEYDYGAVCGNISSDKSPWRIINVFDGDPNTNVVCEGFARSFQYLCELAGIECYCVTGTMDGGGHMWNLVRLDDKIHLLDVTACEGGYKVEDFLYDVKLNPDGYESSNITYVYDKSMFDVYPESILFPAAPDGEVVLSGYCGGEGDGTNISWTLDDCGTLILSGHGRMRNFEQTSEGEIEWRVSHSVRKMIKNVIIEEGITSIGENAFYSCPSIEKITLPSTLTTICSYAFAYAGFEKISIPKSVTTVGCYIFGWCAYEEYKKIKEIYCDVEMKPEGWDNNWNLTDATVYWAGVPRVDSGYCGAEGKGTNLTWSLDKDGTLTISGTGAMERYTCNLDVPWRGYKDKIRTIKICDGVTSISSFTALYFPNLTKVDIADSVTSIKMYAFAECSGLTSVTIPKSVVSVEELAFYNCSGLTDIYCEAEAKPKGWKSSWNGTSALAQWGAKIPDYTPGDFNEDGVVDMKDAAHFIGWVGAPFLPQFQINQDFNADFNKDGTIDMKDAAYFIGWVGAPFLPQFKIDWQ